MQISHQQGHLNNIKKKIKIPLCKVTEKRSFKKHGFARKRGLEQTILAAILDFSKTLISTKLQETFEWNLKYCVLNNSVMCVDIFSVMFLLQIGLDVKSFF